MMKRVWDKEILTETFNKSSAFTNNQAQELNNVVCASNYNASSMSRHNSGRYLGITFKMLNISEVELQWKILRVLSRNLFNSTRIVAAGPCALHSASAYSLNIPIIIPNAKPNQRVHYLLTIAYYYETAPTSTTGTYEHHIWSDVPPRCGPSSITLY